MKTECVPKKGNIWYAVSATAEATGFYNHTGTSAATKNGQKSPIDWLLIGLYGS